MSSYYQKVKNVFARLFVLAVQNKMNFLSFTKALLNSEFLRKIEENDVDNILNDSIENIFYHLAIVQSS